MKILGNIIWLIFGGLVSSIEYFIASILLMLTIIGIPFGLQTLKIAVMMLWPFGSSVVTREVKGGCISTFMNILWILVGGIWISLTHIFFGVLLFITFVGIPFGKQHFKLASLALTPFGKDVVWGN